MELYNNFKNEINIRINKYKNDNKYIKSLKKEIVIFHFTNCNIFLIQIILDYKFGKSLCVICPIFNFCLFTPLNFISLFFLIKSFKYLKQMHKYIF